MTSKRHPNIAPCALKLAAYDENTIFCLLQWLAVRREVLMQRSRYAGGGGVLVLVHVRVSACLTCLLDGRAGRRHLNPAQAAGGVFVPCHPYTVTFIIF